MKTFVTCNGCFDGLHSGHLFFLGFCRGQGDALVVGVNSDEYIITHKRPDPIPVEFRMQALKELGQISWVEEFKEDSPVEFIRRVRPQIHCTGSEYVGRAIEEAVCRELGIKLVYVPRVGNWSTTAARSKR